MGASTLGEIVVAYANGHSRTIDLDRDSVVVVDSPRKGERGDAQARDASTLRNPARDEELLSLSFVPGVLTAERTYNGGEARSVELPVDRLSVIAGEGPGRTAGGADFINRISTRLPLAGAVSVTYARVA